MVHPREGDMIKTIAMVVLAVVIATGGVLLARYAEVDDAPGGVVIGWLIVVAAVVLAVKAFQRRESKS
jgi:hypothetical protein